MRLKVAAFRDLEIYSPPSTMPTNEFHPLAYDKDGEPFAVHPDAVAWRIRRITGRGNPSVVSTQNGPLLLPIDGTGDDLAQLVGAGKYRLDPVDGDGCALQTQPAYTVVGEQPRTLSNDSGNGGNDELIARLLDQNDRMARVLAENMQAMTSKLSDVMNSAARLLEAADRSGMTQRKPLPPAQIVVEKGSNSESADDSGDAMPKWVEQLINTFGPLVFQKVAGMPMPPPAPPPAA